MDDLKHARKRIQNRRYNLPEEEKHRSFSLFRILYHLVMLVMCACIVVLALLLNQKLNLVKLPAVIEHLHIEDVGNWLPFENWFSLKDESVMAKPSYTLLKDNQYTNGTNTVNSVFDGVVVHVQKNADGKSSVSVKQDNGVIATYANVSDVQIKQDERVLKDNAMGTYTTYVSITFLKDNKQVDLSTALQSNKI